MALVIVGVLIILASTAILGEEHPVIAVST
jgi:hypothetical protein